MIYRLLSSSDITWSMVEPPVSSCDPPQVVKPYGAFISPKFVIPKTYGNVYYPPVTNITLTFPLITPAALFVPPGQNETYMGNYAQIYLISFRLYSYLKLLCTKIAGIFIFYLHDYHHNSISFVSMHIFISESLRL